ncbi:MAG: tetratricopeptide repeat protein, partial [Thermodesulfobacteriota bacterium]|nr:tetratricopeptide repeat protein [Thermodesulfobacteriota bacterium]
AILVASGPSLKKNIDLLSEFKGKAVIIAVDSALPALLKRGIEPDFVTAIDYKGHIFDKIASCAPEVDNLSLVCSSWVNKKIPKIFPARNVFWTYTGGAMEKWINQNLGGKIVTPGAGTVAHVNLITAIVMKCSPIVLIGQDLSFSESDSRTDHIDGVTIRTDNLTADMLKSKTNLKWVKANNGGTLPTSRQYYSFINHFENMIRSTPGQYINATEGGAFIEGTEVMTLQEVLDTYCTENKGVLEIIDRINKKERLSDVTGILSEIRMVLKRISRVRKHIKKGEKAADFIQFKLAKLKKSKRKYRGFDELPGNLKKKVMELDKAHDKTDKEHSLWELFDEATMNELMRTDRMKHEIDRLEGDTDRYIEWLEKNLERLSEVSRVRKKLLGEFADTLSAVVTHHKHEQELFDRLETDTLSENQIRIHLALARLYMASEDMVVAKPHLEIVLAELPDNPEANYFMGKIAAHQTEYDKAEIFFSKAESEGGEDFVERVQQFRTELGDEYAGHTAFVRNHGVQTYRYMMMKGLRYCPEHQQLLKECNRFLKNQIKSIESALDESDMEKARETIKQWKDDFSCQPELEKKIDKNDMGNFYKLCGRYHCFEGDNLKAFESFHKAMTFIDKDAENRLLLSDLLFAMGQNDQGLMHFNKALELDQEFVQEYEARKAPKTDQQSGESEADNAGEIFLKGNDLFAQGKYDEALTCYEKVLEIDDTNANVIHNMGAAFKERGDPEKAIECYKKSIALDPNAYNAYFNLGVAYLDMGEKEKAVEYFKNAVALKPDFTGALLNLGNAYKSLGDLVQAENYYKRVIQVDPDYIDAVNNLGVVYQEKGSAEEALACFRNFLEKKCDNPHA